MNHFSPIQNSIRHNLSLHSRFVRIQNEGTGKSSWWMLNPEGGKNGKSPRRRATSMDNSNKFVKSRGRAAKKKVSAPELNLHRYFSQMFVFLNSVESRLHVLSVLVFYYLQMALQEGLEGGAGSPSSQYSTWLGSPNSHSNEDFDNWKTFRTRTSSDASTLSGRRSPFPSEQDDVGESDGHIMYPGVAGAKITSTLPSLSEVSGSMGQHRSEKVMDLLDNLNLLSPKPSQLSSDSSHSPRSSNAGMLQSSPYNSTGLTPHQQQDYQKCLYSQVRMHSLSPAPMQTLPETKPSFGAYENQYIFPSGLLTGEPDTRRDMMHSEVGRASCPIPTYSSQSHVGGHNGVKMMNPSQSHPLPRVNPHTLHSQGPAASQDLNSCNMIRLTSHSGPSLRMAGPRTCMQLPLGLSPHTNDASVTYGSSNSYRELNSVHPHSHHHQEHLPSDLDSVPTERFECDLESVLHDTLMDGGGLDFNFDPAAGPHGFSQRVKTTTHNWVSGQHRREVRLIISLPLISYTYYILLQITNINTLRVFVIPEHFPFHSPPQVFLHITLLLTFIQRVESKEAFTIIIHRSEEVYQSCPDAEIRRNHHCSEYKTERQACISELLVNLLSATYQKLYVCSKVCML